MRSAYDLAAEIDAGDIMDLLITEKLFTNNFTKKSEEDSFISAVGKGYLSVVKHYVENGMYVNARDNKQNTALILAIKKIGDQKKTNNPCLQSTNESAVKNNNDCRYRSIIDLILAGKPYFEATDDDFNSAFMVAVKYGNDEVVELIINKFPEAMLQRDRHGRTSLMLASRLGLEKPVALIISRDKQTVHHLDRNGQNSLMLAAIGGHLKVVHILLEFGGEGQLKIEDNKGMTSLLYAAEHGKVRLVEYLMNRMRRSQVSRRDRRERTCLMLAAKNGHLDVVRYLVEKNAGVGSVDAVGRTSLMHAVIGGHTRVVRYLVNKEDVLHKDRFNHTALDLAISRNHSAVVSFLVNQNSIVNQKSLILAAKARDVMMLRFLKWKMPSPEVNYGELCKCLHLMVSSGEDELTKYLKKKVTTETFGKCLVVVKYLFFNHRKIYFRYYLS